MSDTAAVSSSASTAMASYQAVIALLQKTLEIQKDSMEQILAMMGIGTQVNTQA